MDGAAKHLHARNSHACAHGPAMSACCPHICQDRKHCDEPSSQRNFRSAPCFSNDSHSGMSPQLGLPLFTASPLAISISGNVQHRLPLLLSVYTDIVAEIGREQCRERVCQYV